MQRVDLIIPWRKDPIQLWVPEVKDTTGDGYSITFEDEHGGEGRILFNQKSVAAVVISPPAGGLGQGAQEGDPNYGLPDAPTRAAATDDGPRDGGGFPGPQGPAEEATLQAPGHEASRRDDREAPGVTGGASGAEPDVDTTQEPGTAQEPPPREEPPAGPTIS